MLFFVLAFSSQKSEKSAWEIHYLVSTIPVTYNQELAEMLSTLDSTVVTITASDSIQRYHYYPGESDVQRIYHLTKNKQVSIDPQSLQPIPNPVEVDVNYSVNWNSIIKETGNTKNILGFECVEYAGSTVVGQVGHKMESTSRFWILALPDEKARKLAPQYYLKKGIVLEKENIVKSMDSGNELIYTMQATSVKRLN